MVCNRKLGSEQLPSGILEQQREEVQLHGAIPVEKLRGACVLVELLKLYRVIGGLLTFEVVILRGILRIHDRCCRISLNGITENIPRRILPVSNTRSDVQAEGEQSALCRVVDRSATAILLTVRIFVDTLSVAVVDGSTVVGTGIAAAERQGMLHAHTHPAHLVEPVGRAAEVVACTGSDAVGTILVS